MSQFKSKGLKAARDGLLRYQKSDRPPYPLLYEMFAGRLEPEEVFLKIDQVDYPAKDRERVLFHACLYVGIYLELVQNNQFEAKKLLKRSFENQFGQATGTYMWQIARLHLFNYVKKWKIRKKRQIELMYFSWKFILECKIEPASRIGAKRLRPGMSRCGCNYSI